jgi:hypothetical protein
VAAGDSGAEVGAVTVRVAGTVVPVTATAGGNYFATIEFDDFATPLDGPVAIDVSASNKRLATAVTRTGRVDFIADSDGPVIAIAAPDPGQVVGGLMEIRASVTDTAGVASVVARIAQVHEVALTVSGTTYSGTFDTRALPNTMVFPLVEVIARDGVGNEVGTGRKVTLDNRAPLVSLDPPDVREARCRDGNKCPPETDPFECSNRFDPVGSDAADDGETVGQLFELRARIEDQGNGPLAPSADVLIPHAGVDPGNVRLFLLDSQALPLLVDLDGDSVCDDLNPAIAPKAFPVAANEAAVAALVGLAPAGAAFFSGNIGAVGGDPQIADGQCLAALAPDTTAPPPLCPLTTPTTRILAGLDGGAAIYTLAPVTQDVCMGNAVDAIGSNLSDGWACAVVRAEDRLGNARISAPLRLCIDSDGNGLDDQGNLLSSIGCAAAGQVAAPGSRPSCTDGCTPAQSFADLPGYQVPIRF